MVIPQMMVPMRKKRKRDRHHVCKKNCVWCVVIGHPAIITMHLPVKAVKDFFGGALQKMLSTVVSLDMPAKWTCTCDENVRSVD